MCSVQDLEDFPGENCEKPKEDKNDLTNTCCKKCTSTDIAIVLRGKDGYCHDCYLVIATHKFRSMLGKYKIVRPNDLVLVAHSGNASSTVLTHLIRKGMEEAAHKRLMFKCIVVHIDESSVGIKKFADETEPVASIISEQVGNLGFSGYVVPLSEALRPSEPTVHSMNSYTPNQTEDESIKRIFGSLKSLTAKEDLLSKLRRRLLLRVGKILGCTKIFTSENAEDQAIKTLRGISTGRGAQLQLDTGFADTRNSELMVLRPMRDFTKVELDYYNRHFNLRAVETKKVDSSENSIKSLTRKFIEDLSDQFSGTVSTICRTSEKLSSVNVQNDVTNVKCALCEAIVDRNNYKGDECSALDATIFSRLVSKEGRKLQDTLASETSNCSSNEKSCDCTGGCSTMSLKNFQNNLCYGCQLIFQDCDNIEQLASVVTDASHDAALEKMRQEISDFLL